MNTGISTHELILDFLDHLSVEQTTKDNYYSVIDNFFNWLSNHQLNNRNITIISFNKWIQYLNDNKRIRTRQNYIIIVKKFFKHLHLLNIHEDITYQVEAPKTNYASSSRKSLTKNQARQLLKVINRDTIKGKRDYAIILLMLSNALRSVEVSRLIIKDLEQDGLMIWGKGYKKADKEKINIKQEVFEAIQNYLLNRNDLNDNSPLFCNLSNNSYAKHIKPSGIAKIINQYLKTLNIKSIGMSSHSLRHSAAIIAYESGLSLEDLRIFMRHKDIRTTQEYFKSVEAEKKTDNKPSRVILDKLLY